MTSVLFHDNSILSYLAKNQAKHLCCKHLLFNLQVVVFQEYKNNSTTPIEAKYVFPLDDMAAGVSLVKLFLFSLFIFLPSRQSETLLSLLRKSSLRDVWKGEWEGAQGTTGRAQSRDQAALSLFPLPSLRTASLHDQRSMKEASAENGAERPIYKAFERQNGGMVSVLVVLASPRSLCCIEHCSSVFLSPLHLRVLTLGQFLLRRCYSLLLMNLVTLYIPKT